MEMLEGVPQLTILHLKSSTLFSRKMGTSRPVAESKSVMGGTVSFRCVGARKATLSGRRAAPVSVGEKTHERVVDP